MGLRDCDSLADDLPRWLRLAALAGLTGVALTLGLWPDAHDTGSVADLALAPRQTHIPETTGLPQDPILQDAVAQDELAPDANDVIRLFKVGRGDTLIDLVVKAGADRGEAFAAVTALGRIYDPRRLQNGQEITVTFRPDDSGKLRLNAVSLRAEIDRIVTAATDAGGAFETFEDRVPLAVEPVFAQGTITDSLFLSAQRQHVPAAVIVEVIRMFSFDIDFQREIRTGDRFEIYFERFRDQSADLTKDGDVLYASLTLRGRPLRLYRFTPSDDGRADYFNEDGHSARKSLMRTPIDGARLTSRYGRRKHPVLGYSRMHKGVDFGARRGTPVMAAGDGTVERASRYGGYGNYIRLRHNSRYSTAYAHLKSYARGVRKGKRVKQGQIIGYVGTTGRSTGPHLHYEVLIDKKQTNPLALKLPTGRKLKRAELQAFSRRLALLREDIDAFTAPLILASGSCPRLPSNDARCDTA
ncbi:MAG: M23 family metallopeptidase [Sphingomonadales bacterium]